MAVINNTKSHVHENKRHNDILITTTTTTMIAINQWRRFCGVRKLLEF